jgi:hypothetical protein
MLTKSNYLLGLQCKKLLWAKINDKKRFPELNEITLEKFHEGEVIGDLAKLVFPKGVDLSKLDFKENLEETKKIIGKKVPIFEAGFLVNDLFSRADILVPNGEAWDIVEVKSATKVKEVNLNDIAFQKYVYELAGLKIKNSYLMHINNQYIKDGEINQNELFTQTDVTEKIIEYEKDLENNVKEMLKLMNEKEPEIKIGIQCTKPYECNLKKLCWQNVPKDSVHDFYRMLKKKSFELYNSKTTLMKDVPESIKLNTKQQIQRRLATNGGVHEDKKEIKKFLDKLVYPIYYLDFETINPGIPMFDKMKPYQRIPFQYSLHIQEKKDGELQHVSFLAEGTSDPKPKFLQNLKENLGEEGTILVYNQSFEKGVLREAVEVNQDFKKWLENINPRIVDLWNVFKDFSYYNPTQKGSASIKAVLPAMSNLSYKDLDIKKGDFASLEYKRITYDEWISNEERMVVRAQLEDYCRMDTLAEVEIINELHKIVE